MLCGVAIDHPQGLAGHSDADVGVHALMDALLGAAGLGDIGDLFPDTDAAFAGISSMRARVPGHSIGQESSNEGGAPSSTRSRNTRGR